MIHRDQLHLIEIGNFAQFLGDADFVAPVHRLQRLARNLHVFVVIHREITAIARSRAQRRYAEHVRNEAELLPPSQVKIMGQEPDSRCCFLVFDGLVDGLLRSFWISRWAR
jgi:hypothetical protein